MTAVVQQLCATKTAVANSCLIFRISPSCLSVCACICGCFTQCFLREIFPCNNIEDAVAIINFFFLISSGQQLFDFDIDSCETVSRCTAAYLGIEIFERVCLSPQSSRHATCLVRQRQSSSFWLAVQIRVCVCVWSENRLCLIVNVCFHPKLKNKSFLTSTDLQKFNQINRILTSSLCTRTPLPLLLLPPKSAPFPKFAKEMQSLIKILRSRLISPLKTPIQKPIELFSTFKTRSFLS